jgi:hypothetical protein
MKLLVVVLGLLVSGACSSEVRDADDTGDDAATASTDTASSFEVFRGHGHRDHGEGSPAVRHAIAAAAARIAALQADTIGDNARNGLDDTDPDDSGWDFIVAPTATQHSTAASPTNLYGAIGLAEWAAVETGNAGNRALVAAIDAGTGMQRDPDIDSAPDFVFAVQLAELADNPGFQDLARRHYDAKRAAFGGAAGLGAFIRDARHNSHEDGLIPYDLGWFVLAAAALDTAFPGAGYDHDADTFAGIVVDDLTAASPRFDITDPTEGNYITGLAWAQIPAAWLRDRALVRRVRARLLDQQHADGAWGTSGAQPADDLQSTAHALQTLALTDAAGPSRRAIRRGARWLLRSQAASGGWVDAMNNELPLVDADIVLGLMLSRTEAGEDGLVPQSPFIATRATAAPSTATSRASPLP